MKLFSRRSLDLPERTEARKIIIDRLAPFLKERGFKKRNAVFSRVRGECIDIVEIEPVATDGLKFMNLNISIGVDSPSFWDRIGYRRPTKTNTVHCAISDRLSYFTKHFHTYEARGSRSFSDALTAIESDLPAALTQLEYFDSDEKIIEWLRGRSLYRYIELCRYYSATDQADELNQFIDSLHEEYGATDRWKILARNIRENSSRKLLSSETTELLQ